MSARNVPVRASEETGGFPTSPVQARGGAGAGQMNGPSSPNDDDPDMVGKRIKNVLGVLNKPISSVR